MESLQKLFRSANSFGIGFGQPMSVSAGNGCRCSVAFATQGTVNMGKNNAWK